MRLQQSQAKAAWWPVQDGRRSLQICAARPEAADVQVRNMQQQHPTLRDFRLLLETLGESFMLKLAALDMPALHQALFLKQPQDCLTYLVLISQCQVKHSSHAPYHLLGCD